jgi:hypothetical protein
MINQTKRGGPASHILPVSGPMIGECATLVAGTFLASAAKGQR